MEENLILELENVDFSYVDIYKSFVLSTLKYLSISNFELSIVLCNNDYIQKLNNEFRKKNEPTDILSFNYLEENGKILNEIEGDLVISLEYLDFSTKEFNVPLYEELERVTIHGILHLMGYTHKTNNFLDEEMLILQEAILLKIKRIF